MAEPSPENPPRQINNTRRIHKMNSFPPQKKTPQAIDSKKFVKLILGSIFSIILFGVGLFFLAGRLDYVQGWVLLAICFIILIVSVFSLRKRKDLVKERRNPGPGVKKWDNFIIVLYQIFLYGLLIIAILDSGRFRWSPKFPMGIYILSGLILVLSSAFALWALRVNNFFSSKVRIQKERYHQVITTGPYRFVRHPGYTGVIFMILSLALIMGSLWALIPAGLIGILFVIRTVLEDRVLKEELSGYAEYARKVRYRLIPGIW
ncbi:MAG: isoprenylcysteine carboxylmethyltransferase family protein [Candidatus Aminicenantes bacterium]|nr:isoprenylcysteine carboxylmethyltransferase family protein [Candidatus Aminicenantes bacterium]